MRIVFVILLISFQIASGQDTINIGYFQNLEFSEADSLRGALRLERSCFDVKHYDLNLEVNINNKAINGYNIVRFEYLEESKFLQFDLFDNMHIDEILLDGIPCSHFRKYNAVFVEIPQLKINQQYKLKISYHGKPIEAAMAPWDGGFVWTKDEQNNPWVGVACEGTGASLWWPNKDHLSDEPDSMNISIKVPDHLMAVSNGNLKSKDSNNGFTTYHWHVEYPINNYNVSINIGNYAHFSDIYHSPEKGGLACDYYVLAYNLDKAKTHFKQVNGVLASFEHYFGPYPFWEDGYALIETPYLGMEHQSGIAYGNQYKRGYLGSMIPKDMDWDYIIVHETGHEYWGNAISVKDHADMWIHEGFTTYMEALYVEYHYGREAVDRYLGLQKQFIQNLNPMQGPKHVNFEDFGSSDIYYKGSYMLHTLRNVINDDEAWFNLLRSLYDHFKMKVVESSDIIGYFNDFCNKNYQSFFQQYLELATLPLLEYSLKQDGRNLLVKYRWKTSVTDFAMPIEIGSIDNPVRLDCTTDWSEMKLKKLSASDFWINDIDFLINTHKKNPIH